MTSELEKEFFNIFRIEPKDRFKGCKNGIDFYSYYCEIPSCKGCPKEIREKKYPQITDHILLELICIHKTYIRTYLYSLDYESLKKEVLKDLINEQELRELSNHYMAGDMKNKVRTLFEEDNNNDK